MSSPHHTQALSPVRSVSQHAFIPRQETEGSAVPRAVGCSEIAFILLVKTRESSSGSKTGQAGEPHQSQKREEREGAVT